MPRIAYTNWNPGLETRKIVGLANSIASQYRNDGFNLSLRQLYYQFIRRDYFPNTEASYKRLGNIVNDARLAGMMDWDFIEDRQRELEHVQWWENPQEIISAVARSYHNELWRDQPVRVEVWVEKAALIEIVEQACRPLDVPWFACRGYVSQSEMWACGQRLQDYIRNGQRTVILHLGDHDPSGIDMTRDIKDRLERFVFSDLAQEIGEVGADDEEWSLEDAKGYVADQFFPDTGEDDWEQTFDDDVFVINRLALNMDQVRQYNPPPNPAKITDSRAAGYIATHGRSSWELDALEPQTIIDLITTNVLALRDEEKWDAARQLQEDNRRRLVTVAQHWDRTLELIETEYEGEGD